MDSSKASIAIAQRLGYLADEGLDVDYAGVTTGAGEATTLVASGAVQYGQGSPEPILAAEARGQDLGLVYVYNELRHPIFARAAVLPDSEVHDYADLKGKSIGVLALDPGPLELPKAIVREKGLDPDADVTWVAVGTGAQALTALQRRQVDALFHWDTAYALMENLGAQFRYLGPSTEVAKNLFAVGIFTSRTNLQDNRQEVVGLGRAIAKGTVFMLANPELAIKIHWQQYPQTKPQGLDEAAALKNELHILEARLDKLRIDDENVKKWGAFDQAEWEAYTRLLGISPAQVNYSRIYTSGLVEEINRFDPAGIEAQARSMTAVPPSR